MRKILIAGIALILGAILFAGGYHAGIRHAIEDSEVFLVDFEECGQYDCEIFIELDGEVYTHGLYIG